MNYLLKNKPKYEHKNKIILVFGFFAFLSLLAFFFPNPTRSFFHAVAKPLWSTRSVITRPFVGIGDYFSSKNTLIKNNLLLEEEVSNLKLKEIDYDLLANENQDLKDQLGRDKLGNRVASKVLSRPPVSPYDTLVIDTGYSEGVTLGNKVYLSGNIIAGLVTNVTPHTSLTRLFSSGGGKSEAVLSRTGASFVLVGSGGSNLKLEVPKDTDVLVGDVFVHPGISASTIALVSYIDENSQSSFKTVYLKVPGNLFSTKWVFVEVN